MDNLKLYEAARSVPEEAKKPISAGRLKGMTDINPMWRIKRLTEMFGPCGIGWWYEITDKRIVDDEQTKQRAAFVDISLYFVDPETGATSHAVQGTGGAAFVTQERNGAYLSDECFKMALTDAISVAAKALGIGADVYFQKDRSKYTSPEPRETIEDVKRRFDAPRQVCEDCGRVIVSYPGVNGKMVNVDRHIKRTQELYGKSLCNECAAKRRAEASNDNA